MSTRRSLPSAPGTTRNDRSAPYVCAERLPAELITEVLEYLDQGELWNAAAVSRAFYASAWPAGLYIHRRVRSFADLVVLSDVVQHALRRDLRLSLWFAAFFVDWDPAKEDSLALIALAMVTAALPVSVHLSLHLDESFGPLIATALRHPAPVLQELELSRFGKPGQGDYIVPADFLSGFAPRLRRITLENVSLGSDVVAAFSRINDVALDCDYFFPDMDFSLHLPCVLRLRLSFYTDLVISPRPPCFNFTGISLRKLTIEDCEDASLIPSISPNMNLCDIPALEFGDLDVDWSQPMWRQKTGETLSIRLSIFTNSRPDVSVHIVPESRNWQRICHLREWPDYQPCPIVDIPGIRDRLTYLRMDNLCLPCFLQCDNLTLDALRHIQIDLESGDGRATMLWPSEWRDEWDERADSDIDILSFSECEQSEPYFLEDSYHHVHCRNLDTLTLLALDASMDVDSREAAFLGRALSQTPRPEGKKADLELIGIDFLSPVAYTLLDQTFSSFLCFKFSGLDSPDDKDDGLWDEDI